MNRWRPSKNAIETAEGEGGRGGEGKCAADMNERREWAVESREDEYYCYYIVSKPTEKLYVLFA